MLKQALLPQPALSWIGFRRLEPKDSPPGSSSLASHIRTSQSFLFPPLPSSTPRSHLTTFQAYPDLTSRMNHIFSSAPGNQAKTPKLAPLKKSKRRKRSNSDNLPHISKPEIVQSWQEYAVYGIFVSDSWPTCSAFKYACIQPDQTAFGTLYWGEEEQIEYAVQKRWMSAVDLYCCQELLLELPVFIVERKVGILWVFYCVG